MDWNSFALDAARGSLKNVLIMAGIIIPIMVFLEIARDMKLLDRFSRKVAPLMKVFGMSSEASFPMLAGFIFGISYGAGVLIESARSGRLSRRDLFLVFVFLSVCHAIIEDTALFLAVGANPLIIIVGRLIMAVIVTCLVSCGKNLVFHEPEKMPEEKVE
ncbi:MAG: nucleoside recognition domain-containing protein [Peptococcaceae bacterium]|nr:nucleoside recognition domain-containing protein [Peptococcaceae bacterium]